MSGVWGDGSGEKAEMDSLDVDVVGPKVRDGD